MSEFFGALSTLFRKMETFTNYFADRISASYESFGQAQKVGLLIFVIVVALFVWYILVLVLRFSFKRRTRKLKNVRREYQITLNRAAGKRCNFIWDILLFQKMVILDDPVAPKEMLNEKVYLPFQEEQKRVTATEPQPVAEESNVEDVIVVEPKEDSNTVPEPEVVEEVQAKPEAVEEVQPEPKVVEEDQPEPEVVEEVQPEPEVIEQEEKVVEEKPDVVDVVKKSEPIKNEQPEAEKPKPEKPKAKKPVVKKTTIVEVKKTKKDLIDYMVDKTDLNKSKSNKFLKYFAEVITDALKESDSIKLDGFGTFLVLDIEESTRYIPSKDEMRVLPAHKEVRYRAASELKDLLNVDKK